jgi:hypothetical protein
MGQVAGDVVAAFHAASVSLTPAQAAVLADPSAGTYLAGNQVPDATWRRLLADAGFSRFRRATETPFNRIFEVQP